MMPVSIARMKDQWPPRRFRFVAVAPWIDEVGKRKAIDYLFPKLFANPDPDYLRSYADTTVFFTKDSLVQDILWEVGQDYLTPLTITSRTFDGIEFEEVILL